MYERLTLATSTGLPFATLAFHVATGTAALVAGTIAIVARKGGTLHRKSGLVFVYMMLAMGISAVGISVYAGKASVAGGALSAYLIFTAWTTVRPLPGGGTVVDVAMMLLAALFAYGSFASAFRALDLPNNRIEGVPAGMHFFFAGVITLATIGDARMIRDGGTEGTRRIARHLWRMCFGLFIATGSFVAQLTRMTFMPDWTRSVPVILALAAGPLILLVYWMWRVRLRQNLKGLVTRPGVRVTPSSA